MWYSTLPPNSAQNWINIKRNFHDRFYRLQLEVTIVDLMNLKQGNELVVDFLERFRKLRS